MTTTIQAQREHELAKYRELMRTMPKYGGSNHGKGAVELVARLMAGTTAGLVVDVGCGRNDFARTLCARGLPAIGVDPVYAEAQISASMHEIPLNTGAVAVTTAFDSLEHLLPDDVDASLDELARIGRGGYYVLSIATRPSNILVNGENLHPTVRPTGWWIYKLEERGGRVNQEGGYLWGKWNA